MAHFWPQTRRPSAPGPHEAPKIAPTSYSRLKYPFLATKLGAQDLQPPRARRFYLTKNRRKTDLEVLGAEFGETSGNGPCH